MLDFVETGFDVGLQNPVVITAAGGQLVDLGDSGHPLESADQERRVIDEVEQVTETAGRIFSRPAVQLGLHPPYHDAGREIIRPGHGAGIHRRIFGHYIPSLTDTLPPFPMHAAFPRSEYYGGSAPPAPSAGVAPIPPRPPRREAGAERTPTVPPFTVLPSAD